MPCGNVCTGTKSGKGNAASAVISMPYKHVEGMVSASNSSDCTA